MEVPGNGVEEGEAARRSKKNLDDNKSLAYFTLIRNKENRTQIGEKN